MTDTSDLVVLGDGKLTVRGYFGHVEIVTGSRMVKRQPRALLPEDEERLYQLATQPQIQDPRQGQKWCPGVLGKGCDWRAVEMFDLDRRAADGRYGICKECRKTLYQWQKSAEREQLAGQVKLRR